jgi:hypothetical protein
VDSYTRRSWTLSKLVSRDLVVVAAISPDGRARHMAARAAAGRGRGLCEAAAWYAAPRKQIPEYREVGTMGEKGNLLEASEEVFANLAEQGPQFWLGYQQYKLARDQGTEKRVVAEGAAGTPEWPGSQATG